MKLSNLHIIIKQGRWRIWVGAFFLASILWLFVVSEFKYTYTIEMPIEVRNIKEGKTLTGEVVPAADVSFRATGRALLKTLLLKTISDFKLVLDLEKISTSYDFDLNEYFIKYSQKIVIPTGFELEFLEVVQPSSIHIALDNVMEKKVNVRVNVTIDVAPGFIQVGSLQYTPEVVNLTGPEEQVRTIAFVNTVSRYFNNLKDDLGATLPLDLNFARVVGSSHQSVEIFADIQMIGERIISEVPVEVLNIPDELRVFPSPSTVSLTIEGGTEYIASIKADDIRIYLDFKKQWEPKQVYYTPTVIIPKEIIQWRDLSPKNIELRVTKIKS